MNDQSESFRALPPDANVEIIKSMIAAIDEQLANPDRMATAKGYDRKALAQWMARAKTARQYLVEDMVALRYEAESDLVRLKNENLSLRRKNVFLKRSLEEHLAGADTATALRAMANNALHYAQDFVIKISLAKDAEGISQAIEWMNQYKAEILWNRKNG